MPADALPPAFPLALGPNCMLCVLDSILLRIQGLSGLLLKPPVVLEPPKGQGDDDFLVESPALHEQKSMLLLMMRHMLPRLACLSECWPQIERNGHDG